MPSYRPAVAAAFKPNTASGRIIKGVQQGAWDLIWTAETRAETRAVLTQIPPVSWQPWAECFIPAQEYTGPLSLEPFGSILDPSDRKFAALVAATGATLVTNDSHLLGASGNPQLLVLTPGQFLASVRD